MFAVDLALELLGDAVRAFVALSNPLASFRVLDGHSGHTCATHDPKYSLGHVKSGEAGEKSWCLTRAGRSFLIDLRRK